MTDTPNPNPRPAKKAAANKVPAKKAAAQPLPPSRRSRGITAAQVQSNLRTHIRWVNEELAKRPDDQTLNTHVRELLGFNTEWQAVDQTDPDVSASFAIRFQNMVTDLATLRADHDRLVVAHGETQRQVDQTRSVVNDLGARLTQDHDQIVDLVSRVEGQGVSIELLEMALGQGTAVGRKTIVAHLRERNVSDDDIRRVLRLMSNEEGELVIDDNTFIVEFYTAVNSRLEVVESEVATLKTDVADIKKGGIASVTEVVRLRFQQVKISIHASVWPLIIAAGVAALGWLFFVQHRDYSSGWRELGIVGLIFFLAFFIASFIFPDEGVVTFTDEEAKAKADAKAKKEADDKAKKDAKANKASQSKSIPANGAPKAASPDPKDPAIQPAADTREPAPAGS